MKCETCRFWKERQPPRATDGHRKGYCHFNPPVPMAGQAFPTVNHDEFCSRWKERPRRKE